MDPGQKIPQFCHHLTGSVPSVAYPGFRSRPSQGPQVTGALDGARDNNAGQVYAARSRQSPHAGKNVIGHREPGPFEALILSGFPFYF